MRTLLSVALFAATLAISMHATVCGQQPDTKKTAPKFDVPKIVKPDEAVLRQIAEKIENLHQAIESLKAKKIDVQLLIDVEIYLKAAENIVRFDEWYAETSGKWAIQTLDQGLERAKQAEGGKAPWCESPGKWVVRAYGSRVDHSIQPFAVLLPHDYGKDPGKKWRLDIVLHGRDGSLTEAKFIASHSNKAAPKDLDHVQIEVYGRGNNAYRWAGERDVFEALDWFLNQGQQPAIKSINLDQIILRGFSMGGAGTWHLGLHHPFSFAAIGPGAGFTTTHGYVGGLARELPDYQEKCLRIYDAVDYAENAFDVPVVAYSGANDPQKAAADHIEKALKDFKGPLRFTHLVAPGLEHQMPREWQEKAEAEFKKILAKKRTFPEHVRFVTYTTRYNDCGHGWIEALEHQYEKAVFDSRWTKTELTIATQNIARLTLLSDEGENPLPETMTIDDQKLAVKSQRRILTLRKQAGRWAIATADDPPEPLRKIGLKDRWLQGPIDDAFTSGFRVVPPSNEGWSPALDKHIAAERERLIREWDRYFRGKLVLHRADETIKKNPVENYILFGDPASNPLIEKVLPGLPITWTRDKLVVNGKEYDAKTHLPVLIYPNPLNPRNYVVLNSGHTFREADFKGTNALLYPRLGDWAVIKPAPTPKDPSAYELVAAGLFDEFWQFPKNK